MAKFWTMSVPVISTQHITKSTMDALGSYATILAPYDRGCFAYIGHSEDKFDNGYEDWPEDLRKVADFLWSQPMEISWLRLDSDGEIIDGLPKYDWI